MGDVIDFAEYAERRIGEHVDGVAALAAEIVAALNEVDPGDAEAVAEANELVDLFGQYVRELRATVALQSALSGPLVGGDS